MAQFYNKQLTFPLSGSFTGSFSGSFTGQATGSFTGSFFGNGGGITNISASSVMDLNLFRIGTGSVSASVGRLPNDFFVINSGSAQIVNISNQGAFTLNATGSTILGPGTIPHFFLITSGSRNIFKINKDGVTENKVFESNEIPTAQYGGIYFTSQSIYVGLDQATFS